MGRRGRERERVFARWGETSSVLDITTDTFTNTTTHTCTTCLRESIISYHFGHAPFGPPPQHQTNSIVDDSPRTTPAATSVISLD